MKNFYSILALSLMISVTSLTSCTPDYVEYNGEATGGSVDKAKLVAKWDLKTVKQRITTMGVPVDGPTKSVSSGNSIHVEFKEDGNAATTYNTTDSFDRMLFPALKSYTVTGSELQMTLSNNSPLNVTVQTLNASKLIFVLKETQSMAGQEIITETIYNFTKL